MAEAERRADQVDCPSPSLLLCGERRVGPPSTRRRDTIPKAQGRMLHRLGAASIPQGPDMHLGFLPPTGGDLLPREEDRRQWAEESRGAYRDLVEWKLRQADATSALELWEWYRGAELRADQPAAPRTAVNLGTDNPPDPRDVPLLPSPTVVADRLPLLRDETVVAYGTFPDGIAVWVYDDRGIFSRWIPTSLPPVEELALRLERLCSDPTSDLVA